MGNEMNTEIIVDDRAFEYLKLQKGGLHKFAKDRARWLTEYQVDLWRSFEEMLPHLPDAPANILDVGSGLGGIDILLHRHYAQKNAQIELGAADLWLLDGVDDAAVMKLHRETFSNARVARAFLEANGVPSTEINCVGPHDKDAIHDASPFDIILSLGSWCFHYAPAVYLDMLAGCATGETVFVLDLRRDKGEWTEQLTAKLKQVESIRDAAKFDRGIYRLR